MQKTRWNIKTSEGRRRVVQAAKRRLARRLSATMAAAEDEHGRRVVRPVEQAPGTVVVCDEPADGAAVARGTTVSGWAYSPAGIKEVTVWLDGQPVGQAERGLERPDVADGHPEWSDALRSGFRYRLGAVPATASAETAELTTETAELTIVAEDGQGRRAEVRRVVQAAKSLRDPILVCDEPADGAAVARGTAVSGWAYSPAGIKEVTVWLDGQPVGQAERGLERPDVADGHPEWSDALRSGFRYRLDVPPALPLPRTVELAVVAEDKRGRRTEVRWLAQAIEPPLPMAGSLDIPILRPPQDPLREMGWSSPLVVFGWAADPNGVERIDVLLDGQVVAQAEHGLPREDVELLNPDYRRLGLAGRSGWLAVIPTEGFGPGQHTVSATVHGGSGTLPLGPTAVWLRDESVRAHPDRQRRLEVLFRCPKCGGSLERGESGLVCAACGHAIRSNEFGTLLFDETYADLDWRDAVATSHGYPLEVAEVIMDCREGLVLDIGAGLRENLPNVVQLDAIAFPTSDVSANAEALPFADEAFDGVVACNLLEHVSDPKAVIREMRRVCKVGGRIYADFTSVHPYHGFPHHYFNATQTGLDWLMREAGGAEGTAGVTDARITLMLILQQWLGSLEDAEARAYVEGLTVADFVALLSKPGRDQDRYEALDNVFANGRRLIPPKVTFTGTRTR